MSLCTCSQGAASAALDAMALAGAGCMPHTYMPAQCPLGVCTLHRLRPVLLCSVWTLLPAQISIGDLKLRACKAMGLEEGDVRIWDYWNESRHAPLEGRLDDSAQAAKLFDSQDILLEEKVCWHLGMGRVTRCSRLPRLQPKRPAPPLSHIQPQC